MTVKLQDLPSLTDAPVDAYMLVKSSTTGQALDYQITVSNLLADFLTDNDVGLNTGDLIQLVDNGGTPALPAISGALLTNLPQVTGTGSVTGGVRLSDSLTSTSNVNSGFAATPLAVKTLQDAKLNKSGGTLTGVLNLLGGQTAYATSGNHSLNLDNSDVIGLNGLYFSDTSTEPSEGILWPRASGTGLAGYSSLWANDTGVLKFAPTANSTSYDVWHTGNDGSGSGLDADTVDGVQASVLARNNATNTFTQIQTVNNASATPLRLRRTVGAEAKYVGFYDQTGATRLGYVGLTSGDVMRIENEFSGGHLTLGSNVLQFNSNNVWHAGNDGSGSTLDADTVDGLHASQFLRSDQALDFTTGLTVSGGQLTVTNNVTWGGSQSGNPRAVAIGYSGGNYGGISYGVNYSGIAGQHTYEISDVVTRVDLNDGIEVYAAPADEEGEIVSWTALLECQRNKFTYKNNTIWHAGNDGAGSGLDADLLDGSQASAFAKIATAQTWSAVQTFSTAPVVNNNIAFQGKETGGTPRALVYIDTSNIVRLGNTNTATRINGTSLQYNDNGTVRDILHTGSTLDADTLDGINSTSFGRLATAQTWSAVQTHSSNVILNNNVELLGKETGGINGNLIKRDASNKTIVGTPANPTVIEGFTIQYDNGTNIYNILHSGMTINANQLEGISASSFVRDTGDESIAGIKTFTNDLRISADLRIGTETRHESNALAYSRRTGSAFEWGHTNLGYTNTLGAWSSGNGYIAFNCFEGTNANTLRTTGRAGMVLESRTNQIKISSVSSTNADNQTPVERFRVDNAGDAHVSRNLYMNGTNLYGDNKIIAQYSDTWLRLNPSSSFSSGIYVNSGKFRIDGDLQVGTTSTNGFYATQSLLQFQGNTIWHAGNDGAGSALDADRLDGYEASAFPRFGTVSNASDYMYFTRNSTSPPLFVNQRGTGDIARFFKGSSSSVFSDADQVTIQNNADVYSTGNIEGYQTSDIRSKSNIRAIENPLEKVKSLRACEYDKEGKEERETGLIAQDVEKVIDNLVKKSGSSDYLKIKTGGHELIALLVGAIQELSEQVDELKRR